MERDQITDEVEREKELQVKTLGEEVAGKLGLQERHLFGLLIEFAAHSAFIDLGPVLFFSIKLFAAGFRFAAYTSSFF